MRVIGGVVLDETVKNETPFNRGSHATGRFLAPAAAFAIVWNYFVAGWIAMHLSVAAAAVEDDFQPHVYRNAQQRELNYRLLVPRELKPGEKYPLVLFLHGAGERGSDNKAQLKHVVSIFVDPENRRRYPCFVLAPQCPSGEKWVDVNWFSKTHETPENPAAPMALVLEVIEQLCKDQPIDTRWLYVMGLSMGGYGTWDLLVRKPEMFAAAVPICGGGDETKADKLVGLPIWCFHGDKDTAVPVARSRNMIEAIKKAGGQPKYTEYPGVGHDSWTPATKEAELLPWLFGQKRGD